MADTVGSLKVLLGLDAAEYTRGLTKAEKDAERFAAQIDKGIKTAVNLTTIALSGMALAATAAFAAVDQLAKQAATFQDLAEKTGANAEALASFSVAAQVAGANIVEVANFSIKLSKNLAGVDDESKAAGAALTAMGIPIKEFKALKPEEQIERLAKALAGFSDVGGGKTAALEALAKGGAQLLPFLKELEQQGGRQVILTQRQIELADEYADKQARLRAELNLYAQVAAIQVLPAINSLTGAAKDFIAELIGIDTNGKKLRDSNAIVDFANNTVQALGFIISAGQGLGRVFQVVGETIAAGAAQTAAVASGDLKRAVAIGRDWQDQVDRILQKQLFSAQLSNRIKADAKTEQLRAQEDRGFRPPGKTLPFSGAVKSAATDNTARKILDGQLRDLNNFIKAEEDTLRDREQFLSIYYQDDQIGLRDFFSGRRAALEEAISKESALLDKQAALLKVAAGKRDALQEAKGLGIDPDAIKAASELAAKAETRIDAETKLADVLAKKARLEQDGVTKGIQLFQEEGHAVKQFRESIEQANIALLEMRGDSVAAATASFDFANRRRSTQIKLLSQSPSSSDQAEAAAAAKALSDTRALIEARAQLNKATEDYSLTLGALENAQARINILTSVGAIGEIEGLKRTSELRAKYVEKLREQIEIAERAANAIDAPEARARALAGIDAMKVKLEELAATGDLVAQKFNKILGDAFSENLQALVKGEKSLRDALKDFGSQVQSKLVSIAADQLSQQLFGKGGPLSGAGDILSKIFGGKGAGDAASAAAAASLTTSTTAAATAMSGVATSATAVATADAAVSTAATVVATALGGVSAAAASAAAALASVSASSAASGIAGAFGGGAGGLAFAASGTTWARGGATVVGENGPEIMNLPPGTRVTPKNMAGNVYHSRVVGDVIINMPGGTTASPRQIRNAARDGVMTAIRDR